VNSKIEKTTQTYHASIDCGEGGETTLSAASLKDALVQAILWADEGDWPTEGCDVDVRVWTEDEDGEVDEEDSAMHHIDSTEERKEAELDENGEVIAERVLEWETEHIVVMDGEAYLRNPNGGRRGAHNRQDGDGQWREHPCSPTRRIDRDEARCLMLDWGYEVAEVAAETRKIID
jgi:hypothetical protein